MSYFSTCRPELAKAIVSTFEFDKMQNFLLNKKKKVCNQNCLFQIFLDWNFKRIIVIFESSTLKFVKNKFLTEIVNFGIGSTFSKCPGSTFSEGPCPGPGQLFKLCHYSSASGNWIWHDYPTSLMNIYLFSSNSIWQKQCTQSKVGGQGSNGRIRTKAAWRVFLSIQ